MRDLLAGVRCLLGGLRWLGRHPRQWLFGLVPALITLLLYVVVLVVVLGFTPDVITLSMSFTDGWAEPWRTLTSVVAGVALVGVVVLVGVLLFTAVTLAIGAPFYDKLSERVDADLGDVPPEVRRPVWRDVLAAVTDGLRLVVYAGVVGAVLFALGFIPVAGQTVVPAVGACVSGFFLTVELTATPAQRRGLTFRQRFGLLRRRKALAVGFGTPLFLLFLVPFAAVVLMPAGVVGATLLARERLAG